MDALLKRTKVVGIGEVLWDVLPEGKKLGGAPANFAYHVSQFGLDGVAVSAIGNDGLGEEIVKVLSGKKLATVLQRNDFPTGTVDVVLDLNGIPTYDITNDVAWDHIHFDTALENLALQTKAVCFGSLAQRGKESRECIRNFVELVGHGYDEPVYKIFDINLRQNFYSKELIEESMHMCNVMKINDDELLLLKPMLNIEAKTGEQFCRRIMERYKMDMIVLTCGIDGSYVFAPDVMSYQPTPVVEVVDTVGAGDSFTASFVACLLKGMPVKDAHERAVAVSAFVCASEGAMPLLPDELL